MRHSARPVAQRAIAGANALRPLRTVRLGPLPGGASDPASTEARDKEASMATVDPWYGDDDTDCDYYDTPAGNTWCPDDHL